MGRLAFRTSSAFIATLIASYVCFLRTAIIVQIPRRQDLSASVLVALLSARSGVIDVWSTERNDQLAAGRDTVVGNHPVFADMVASLAYLKWRGEDVFMPLGDYVGSMQVALPPAAVAAGSYLLALLTGIPVRDVPRASLKFARNSLLQSNLYMVPFIALSTASIIWVARHIQTATPPAYGSFVAKLLGGEADDHAVARKALEEIRTVNPILAGRFETVLSVFEERRKQSSGDVSAARANVLIRTLEANIEDDWREHPLRWHGLAESYLLAAQGAALGQSPLPSVGDQFDKAIKTYREVAESRSPYATELLRKSAINNIGNAYYYQGKYRQAIATYRELVDNERSRNTSAWGNLVAALQLEGNVEEAIAEGRRAIAWAEAAGKAFSEPYQFASILENTGHAYWIEGDYKAGHELVLTARAFRDDPLNRANLAISYALNGDREAAAREMRRVQEPATARNAMSIAKGKDVQRCHYLYWAAVSKNSDFAIRAANLSVFLQEPKSENTLNAIRPKDLAKLAARALEALKTIQAPCSSLGSIQGFRELLLPPDG